MKPLQSLAIGTVMALGLAACSSTPMDNSGNMSGSSASSATTAAGMEGANGSQGSTSSQGAGSSTVGTTGDGTASGKSPGLSNNATSPSDVR